MQKPYGFLVTFAVIANGAIGNFVHFRRFFRPTIHILIINYHYACSLTLTFILC